MFRFLLLVFLPSLVFSMIIWPEITSEDGHLTKPRPQEWNEKNFGQWCRNFTVHKHTQCPEASLFHEYSCCGESNTECCFAVQGWLVVVGGISSVTTSCILIFFALLKFNIIYTESIYPPKVISI